jgi:hypothetical protein
MTDLKKSTVNWRNNFAIDHESRAHNLEFSSALKPQLGGKERKITGHMLPLSLSPSMTCYLSLPWQQTEGNTDSSLYTKPQMFVHWTFWRIVNGNHTISKKGNPITGLDRPWGVQEVEAPGILLNNRWLFNSATEIFKFFAVSAVIESSPESAKSSQPIHTVISVFLVFILILSTRPCINLSSIPFLSVFLTKVCMHFSFHHQWYMAFST